MLISEDDRWHYTAIKSLSRLLASKNSKHHGEQYFCTNCLQGFTLESSRDEHYGYCNDNETIRVEMPKKGSTIEFYYGQNQFKVPFMMYVDFEAILNPIKVLALTQVNHTPKRLISIFLLDFAFTGSSLMVKLKIHWNSIEVRIV